MESHPLRMRGLKHQGGPCPLREQVASFTDAWIETLLLPPYLTVREVASFTDAWIETSNSELVQGRCVCRILYGCVD